MEYKDFQKRAIRRIVDNYICGDVNRILLSDEVGLGKTIIAKGVIRCLLAKRFYHSSGVLSEFRVMYLCSNLNIAAQNQRKLGLGNSGTGSITRTDFVLDPNMKEEEYKENQKISKTNRVDENRLTMLTAKYYNIRCDNRSIRASELAEEYKQIYLEDEVYSFLNDNNNKDKDIALIILPITPKTSVDIKRQGCPLEREYIRKVLKLFYDVPDSSSKFKGYDFSFVKNNQQEIRSIFQNDLPDKLEDFVQDIKINQISDLDEDAKSGKSHIWEGLRRLFARATLKWLKYDLAIMDEFQNFQQILEKANDIQREKKNRSEKTRLRKEMKALLLKEKDSSEDECMCIAYKWTKGLWNGEDSVATEIYRKISNKKIEYKKPCVRKELLNPEYTIKGMSHCLKINKKDKEPKLWDDKEGCLKTLKTSLIGIERSSDLFFKAYKDFQSLYIGKAAYIEKPLDAILALSIENQGDEQVRYVVFNTIIQLLYCSGKSPMPTAKSVENPQRLGYYIWEFYKIFKEYKETGQVSIDDHFQDNNVNDCENEIIRHVFDNEIRNNGSYVDILMLSATPFKMELGDEGKERESGAATFSTVCGFLDNIGELGLTKKLSDYKQKLEEYAKNDEGKIGLSDVVNAKNSFQNAMIRSFSRMERSAVIRAINEELFIEGDKKLSISNSDDELISYDIGGIWDYLKEIDNIWKKIDSLRDMRIQYGENAPYLFSFMNAVDRNDEVIGYKAKEMFDKEFEAMNLTIKQTSYLYLSKKDYEGHVVRLGCWHGVFNEALRVILDLDKVKIKEWDNHPGAARLLWIPTCTPRSDFGDVYMCHKDYGKTILFSRYVMIPRMVAGLVSYEADRRLLWLICKNGNIDSSAENYNEILRIREDVAKSLKGNKDLRDTIVEEFCHPAVLEFFSDKLEDVNEEQIKRKIKEYISMPLARGILEKVFLGEPTGLLAVWATKGFVLERNNINPVVEQTKENIISYCKDGRLLDTLSEWLYLCLKSEEEISEFIGLSDDNESMAKSALSFVKGSSLDVDMYDVDQRKSEVKMHIYFARCIGINKDQDKINAMSTLQKSFNCPFAPFVFATTSMGQEGLDFHLFADRIIHWNLPSDPIDFEQREGRINRYNCLAIRRKAIEWWYEKKENDTVYESFNNAFKRAEEAPEVKNCRDNKARSGLFPNWILQNQEGTEVAGIKRYVPYFANSRMMEEYHNHLKLLQLYRTVIGQSDPVEVIERLMVGKSSDEIKQLFVDFSPYYIKH